jgi:hypothetical protein
VKLFLKNKINFFAKNHCEIQVRTILVGPLYAIEYDTPTALGIRLPAKYDNSKLEWECPKSRKISSCNKRLMLNSVQNEPLLNTD